MNPYKDVLKKFVDTFGEIPLKLGNYSPFGALTKEEVQQVFQEVSAALTEISTGTTLSRDEVCAILDKEYARLEKESIKELDKQSGLFTPSSIDFDEEAYQKSVAKWRSLKVQQEHISECIKNYQII